MKQLIVIIGPNGVLGNDYCKKDSMQALLFVAKK